MMQKVLQTGIKRTVRRRLARLRETGGRVGPDPWVSRGGREVAGLICTVGSVRLPSTTNAIERFFRAFERFYKTRQGFHSVLSAKRELLLFLVRLCVHAAGHHGPSPIEVLVPRPGGCPVSLDQRPFRRSRSGI